MEGYKEDFLRDVRAMLERKGGRRTRRAGPKIRPALLVYS